MTEALNRVIAEQQKRIDELTEGNKKLIERAANVFKRNDDLFEEVAKLIDCRITPDGLPEKEWEAYLLFIAHKALNCCATPFKSEINRF